MNYDQTIEGQRRISNPVIYEKSLQFQKEMKECGVAWHNHFADECTIDFACCCGDMPELYNHHIPSFRIAIKQAFEEYYQEIIQFDGSGHLKRHMDKFIKDNY
jgi:hypothetical protein